jgi:putative DNA primase/helicase
MEPLVVYLLNFMCMGMLLPIPYVLLDLDAQETPIYDKQARTIVSPLAMRMMQAVPSYTELSPHNGLHIITEGTTQRGNFRTPQLEMYSNNWFSTITTRHLSGTPLDVTNQQEAIAALENEFHPPQPTRLIQNTVEGAGRLTELPPQAANDRILQALLSGDMSMVGNDHHRADWHLLMKLLHWTGDDISLTKQVFLASPLGQRAKAQPGNREGRRGNTTYLDRTIERIIQNRWNPPTRR